MAAETYTWDDAEILFVGAGTMGASLAQAYAQNGFVVGMLDVSDEILSAARGVIDRELNSARGRIFTDGQITAIKSRILTTTSYETACAGKSLNIVIEAATERIDIKKKIFRTLDTLCAPHVVLATNSSSLDANILARETSRPDKVVWMHYFYLPHKNRGGEYAGTDAASGESIATAEKYMKLGGKIPTRILSSRKGGAADIIFVSLLLESVRMVEEGYAVADIEAAGRRAFFIPAGFQQLMDMTGLPVGLFSMNSFSDSSDPDDPLYRAYKNFFTPPQVYIDLMEKYAAAEDKETVKWIPDPSALNEPADESTVQKLCDRFRGVGFMTSVEVVESGVVAMEDLEYLCQNAFVWQKGPFTIMNELGIGEVMRVVRERSELAQKQGIYFPVPKLLQEQAAAGKPWDVRVRSVFSRTISQKRIAWITFSSPKTANAMDNRVFAEFREAFAAADSDPGVKAVIFDTAPIKTFIAGANVPGFVENIRAGKFDAIREDTRTWQKILFGVMTRSEKPRIALVDGQAFGGGVEVAMAFADDPNAVVVITERTSYALPETRLGIYPGLRGTLLLPQLIYRATGDEEMAVAIARYYILAGGTVMASPRVIHYLGLADVIVPSHRRDEAALAIAGAVVKNGGRALTKNQLDALDMPRLPESPTFEEKEELRVMKDLFLNPSLIALLSAYGQGWHEPFLVGKDKALVQQISRRVFNCSPHAVYIADALICRGFKDFLGGAGTGALAERELDRYLPEVFEHPDALEGLSAMTERRFPEFNRAFPF